MCRTLIRFGASVRPGEVFHHFVGSLISLQQPEAIVKENLSAMPITFHPKPGHLLACDFTTGFQPPDMVKVRTVVVISVDNAQLCTVVPLSSTPPNPVRVWHHQMDKSSLLPSMPLLWVKGDCVQTVALRRLDRVRSRDSAGKRVYFAKMVSSDDLAAVRLCVAQWLGLSGIP